jgi:disulfide bond formation protein DsbB
MTVTGMVRPGASAPSDTDATGDAGTGAGIALRISFVIALAATLGSLFVSEVLGYAPCVLCWYQRMAMFPLAVIFFVALWSGDARYARYSLPLASLGLAIAVYHNLLYYGVIPETIAPCEQGVSCTTRQVEILGFVTVPLMSLAAFLCLAALEVLTLRRPQIEARKESSR